MLTYTMIVILCLNNIIVLVITMSCAHVYWPGFNTYMYMYMCTYTHNDNDTTVYRACVHVHCITYTVTLCKLQSLLTLWYVSMISDDSIQNRCDICNYVIIKKVQLHKIDIVLMTSTFWNLTYH